ncbi:MAG: hypothetical protein ACPGJU_07750 [Coraliomargarita sp.]
MILQTGERIFVASRRTFEGDQRRHFIGEVESCTEHTVRVTGYVFIMSLHKKFEKRPEKRTQIIPLNDARNIINVIPQNANLDKIEYITQANRLYLSDGDDFLYDINEFRAE